MAPESRSWDGYRRRISRKSPDVQVPVDVPPARCERVCTRRASGDVAASSGPKRRHPAKRAFEIMGRVHVQGEAPSSDDRSRRHVSPMSREAATPEMELAIARRDEGERVCAGAVPVRCHGGSFRKSRPHESVHVRGSQERQIGGDDHHTIASDSRHSALQLDVQPHAPVTNVPQRR